MDFDKLLISISDMLDEKLGNIADSIIALAARQDKMELKQDQMADSIMALAAKQDKMELKQDQMTDSIAALELKYVQMADSIAALELKYVQMTDSIAALELKYDKIADNITALDSSVRRLELTQELQILPRLQTIESCYLSTYERYQKGVDEHEEMKQDIAILKKITAEHHALLQQMA